MIVTPTQSQIQQALAAFINAVLAGVVGNDGNPVEVIAGVDNRVPEPSNDSFVVMTVIRSPRLATNIDSGEDCKFTGSIAGTTMTVSAVLIGTVQAGATVFGVGVAATTVVQRQLTGAPGGIGTYQVSVSQTLGSETLSAGLQQMIQKGEFVVQCDFHAGTNNTAVVAPTAPSASDLAKTVSTALRDEFASDFFDGLAPPLNGVRPLYADDPRYAPFINENSQYEWRWTLEVHLQVDQTVVVPQQFADALSVTVLSVQATYGP